MNKRIYSRVEYEVMGSIFYKGNKFEIKTIDISRTGLQIELPVGVRIGELVKLKIDDITTLAQVVWYAEFGDCHRAGIEFMKNKSLQEYLDKKCLVTPYITEILGDTVLIYTDKEYDDLYKLSENYPANAFFIVIGEYNVIPVNTKAKQLLYMQKIMSDEEWENFRKKLMGT